MVEGDDVDATLSDARGTADAVGCNLNDVTVAFQILLHKPAQAWIGLMVFLYQRN